MVMAPGGPGPRPPQRARTMIERAKVVQSLISKLDQETMVRYVMGALRNQFALIDSDLTSRLWEIEVPTLVVHGDSDGQVPYHLGEELSKRIRNSEMITIGVAGHGVMNWDENVKAIRLFCNRVRPY